MVYSGHILEDLAWQVEMGADEALGDVPGLMLWKARPTTPPLAAATQRPMTSPPTRPSALAAALDSLASFEPAPPLSASVSIATPPPMVTASTLEELRASLDRFEGCQLKKTAMNLVFADGNPRARVMVIGDVPAEDEDRQGVPFAGASGLLLDRMLRAIDLDRSSVYLTNLVFWRPPGNRTPSETEIAACLPFVRQHIALVRPQLLVLMGATPSKILLHRKEPFAKIRGRWSTYLPFGEDGGDKMIPCLPMYHPAYLLRQPAAKRLAWADLLALKQKINELST